MDKERETHSNQSNQTESNPNFKILLDSYNELVNRITEVELILSIHNDDIKRILRESKLIDFYI